MAVGQVRLCPHSAQEAWSVEAGHAVVTQHYHAVGQGAQNVEGHHAIGGLDNSIALLLQHRTQPCTYGGIVVYDEHAELGWGVGCWQVGRVAVGHHKAGRSSLSQYLRW